MPTYYQLGEVPAKRHSIFRQKSGALYTEELMGNHGFTGPSTLAYHIHPPTQVLRAELKEKISWEREPQVSLRHRHFETTKIETGASPTTGRVPVLFNKDVALSVVNPTAADDFFYRNAQGDEVVYVTEGSGVLETCLGELPYRKGDYVVIPRGILHRYRMNAEPHRFLVIESAGYVRTPRRYRNEFGQLLESAPYSERDFHKPVKLAPRDEKGEFRILVKKENSLNELVVAHHPWNVVGWDGYYYPYTFNIADFEPRVGRFHLPPPTHQTFEGDGFVVCSFCPRPYDFDPTAIPAPYNHSNVMSDEVLYYANSEFMSRKGIRFGSMTLHPDGIPHGPHPGKTEESIGQKRTDELAVMVDTFLPLHVNQAVLQSEDRDYHRSWIE
jgi:homogentisate 1,2-dioxygenase